MNLYDKLTIEFFEEYGLTENDLLALINDDKDNIKGFRLMGKTTLKNNTESYLIVYLNRNWYYKIIIQRDTKDIGSTRYIIPVVWENIREYNYVITTKLAIFYDNKYILSYIVLQPHYKFNDLKPLFKDIKNKYNIPNSDKYTCTSTDIKLHESEIGCIIHYDDLIYQLNEFFNSKQKETVVDQNVCTYNYYKVKLSYKLPNGDEKINAIYIKHPYDNIPSYIAKFIGNTLNLNKYPMLNLDGVVTKLNDISNGLPNNLRDFDNNIFISLKAAKNEIRTFVTDFIAITRELLNEI